MTINAININVKKETEALPRLEIVSKSGDDRVAEVFVARTRQGDDSSLIEFVDGLDPRFAREEKWIINVSTQFGCPIKCIFCDAGHKFYGNLTRGEMLAQAAYVLARRQGLARICGKLKVHFARMGEPSLNDSVIDALEELPELCGAHNLMACVPTTAPKGREDWFERLLDVKRRLYRRRFQLQFSVNSTDEAERARLMPIKLQTMDWMAAYSRRFVESGDRKVSLNFALAKETPFDEREIIARFSPGKAAVKITAVNPTTASAEAMINSFDASSPDKRILEKIGALQAAGFETILSVGDGRENEIGSNCGQSVRRLRSAGNF